MNQFKGLINLLKLESIYGPSSLVKKGVMEETSITFDIH